MDPGPEPHQRVPQNLPDDRHPALIPVRQLD